MFNISGKLHPRERRKKLQYDPEVFKGRQIRRRRPGEKIKIATNFCKTPDTANPLPPGERLQRPSETLAKGFYTFYVPPASTASHNLPPPSHANKTVSNHEQPPPFQHQRHWPTIPVARINNVSMHPSTDPGNRMSHKGGPAQYGRGKEGRRRVPRLEDRKHGGRGRNISTSRSRSGANDKTNNNNDNKSTTSLVQYQDPHEHWGKGGGMVGEIHYADDTKLHPIFTRDTDQEKQNKIYPAGRIVPWAPFVRMSEQEYTTELDREEQEQLSKKLNQKQRAKQRKLQELREKRDRRKGRKRRQDDRGGGGGDSEDENSEDDTVSDFSDDDNDDGDHGKDTRENSDGFTVESLPNTIKVGNLVYIELTSPDKNEGKRNRGKHTASHVHNNPRRTHSGGAVCSKCKEEIRKQSAVFIENKLNNNGEGNEGRRWRGDSSNSNSNSNSNSLSHGNSHHDHDHDHDHAYNDEDDDLFLPEVGEIDTLSEADLKELGPAGELLLRRRQYKRRKDSTREDVIVQQRVDAWKEKAQDKLIDRWTALLDTELAAIQASCVEFEQEMLLQKQRHRELYGHARAAYEDENTRLQAERSLLRRDRDRLNRRERDYERRVSDDQKLQEVIQTKAREEVVGVQREQWLRFRAANHLRDDNYTKATAERWTRFNDEQEKAAAALEMIASSHRHMQGAMAKMDEDRAMLNETMKKEWETLERDRLAVDRERSEMLEVLDQVYRGEAVEEFKRETEHQLNRQRLAIAALSAERDGLRLRGIARRKMKKSDRELLKVLTAMEGDLVHKNAENKRLKHELRRQRKHGQRLFNQLIEHRKYIDGIVGPGHDRDGDGKERYSISNNKSNSSNSHVNERDRRQQIRDITLALPTPPPLAATPNETDDVDVDIAIENWIEGYSDGMIDGAVDGWMDGYKGGRDDTSVRKDAYRRK